MNAYSPSRLVTLSAAVALSLFSLSATAQSLCDPKVQQAVNQQAAKNSEEAAKRAEDIYGGHMKQPDWLSKSDGLLTACYKASWPNFKPSNPLLANLYNKASEKAVKAACDKAREQVAKGAASYQSVLKTVNGYQNVVDQGASSLGNWMGTTNTGAQVPAGAASGNTWSQIGGLFPNAGIVPGVTGAAPASTGATAPARRPTTGTGVPGVTP